MEVSDRSWSDDASESTGETVTRASNRGDPAPRRRAVLVGVSAALTSALAGCSSDGGEGEPGGSEPTDEPDDGAAEPTATGAPTDEPTPTATATESGPVQDPMGSVRRNDIDELEIVGYESSASGNIFSVDITVVNDGDEATDVEAYSWALAPYDESGQELTVSTAGPALAQDDQPVEPGSQSVVYYEVRPDDASEVESYELYLTCEGRDADGVYCPE